MALPSPEVGRALMDPASANRFEAVGERGAELSEALSAAPTGTRIDVCLVLYQPHLELLALTFSGLEHQENLGVVRIHDNGATTSRAEVLRYCPASLRERVVYTTSDNAGFAAGQNRLIEGSFRAGASHALVLNPDLQLAETALSDLRAASRELDDRHLVSGVILFGDRGEIRGAPADRVVDSAGIEWTASARHLDVAHGRPMASLSLEGTSRTSALTGALILVPRRAWSRVIQLSGEFFDEDFFAYREDAELGLRATRVGVGSYVTSRVVGMHYRGTPGVSRKSALVNRLSVQNRFLLRYRTGAVGRPGNLVLSLTRDVAVAAMVHLRERDSLDGLRNARRLRPRMIEKRRRLAAAVERPEAHGSAQTWGLRAAELTAPHAGRVESDVWIIIPAYNPDERLVASVTHLGSQFRVVVVDDGSGAAFAWSALEAAIVLRSATNLGVASALNIGLSYALAHGAQYLVMLDQDSQMTTENVRNLVDVIQGDDQGEIGAVGPGSVAHLSYGGVSGEAGLIEVPEVLQSGMTVRREVLEACGLMDESLVIDGVDTDFCLRLRRQGYRVLADPRVRLEHQLGDSAEQPARRIGPFRPLVTHHNPTRRYYMNRNRVRLLRRYGRVEPRWAALTIRRTVVGDVMAAAVESNRREKVRAILTGLRDGMLGRSGRAG
ncbi:glycosyltransferase [Nocardioides sp. cx-169]|uniref:glycosyltransferase n=1 Tax=Nocardioides sp. cx-169 TaxID=2899080 RepID=UPI001E619AB2|nr:glycosyltransferase [Nocardioides sp. cx-169]MCD4533148.1 glycosyltransferase [Nocardioides sp. cx-169]